MPAYKLLIEVLRDGKFFMKDGAYEISKCIDTTADTVARKAATGGVLERDGAKYLFRYTGEKADRRNSHDTNKPKPKKKPKQSIKKVVAAARKAGMSYGQYVAKMEAEGRS